MTTNKSANALEFWNTGLLFDEVLLELALVFEEGWPAGPGFLSALGSVVESSIIHDHVYFDPTNYLRRDDLGGKDVTSILRSSTLVKELMTSSGLMPFPDSASVDAKLEEDGIEYSTIDFLSDAMWTGTSFLWGDPEGELAAYQILDDVLDIPTILTLDRVAMSNQGDASAESGFRVLSPEDANAYLIQQALEPRGFSNGDLIVIEGMNHRAKAHLELSVALGSHLYPSLAATPYQFGAIKSRNSTARSVYEKVSQKVLMLDGDLLEGDPFFRVPIPPLVQIVLEKCKGDSSALPTVIGELRHRHRNFRKYLTDYERAWATASRRDERQKIRKEFENAWAALVTRTERPGKHLLYTLWDILKVPPRALTALGDIMANEGKELSVIGQVKGLYDFWWELWHSPVPESNAELVRQLCRKVVDEEVWRTAARVMGKANTFILDQSAIPNKAPGVG